MKISDNNALLVCTGAPVDRERDVELAARVAGHVRDVLICGGTTSKIISRELKREISVNLKRDPKGLPPTSVMEGVALITEGILTLCKVRNLLAQDLPDGGTGGKVKEMMLSYPEIVFIVGTSINPAYNDPNLPVEFESRLTLVESIAGILSSKYGKKVSIEYL